MSFDWIKEDPPLWDVSKAAVVGAAPDGTLEIAKYQQGELLAGDWWRVEEDGETVGYGWMDSTWGDAEILLAVAPDQQKRGVGTYILDRLEEEALSQGQNYLYNIVPATHPNRQGVTDWLKKRSFERSQDDLLKRRVRHQAV